MKRNFLTVLFACFTLAMMAQDAIKVNYKGAKPNIVDFAWAFLFSDDNDEDECDQEATAGIKEALKRYRQGVPQNKNVTFTVDQKNGYILYEWKDEDGDNSSKTEMCYWNEADGKHKLFAYSTWYFSDGKPNTGQYDGINFWRYDNATKKMRMLYDPGFQVEYQNTCYTLPRVGKDIIVTTWSDNGKKTQKILKWNGRRFNK